MSLSSILGTIAGKVSGFITKDVEPAILALLGEIEHDVVARRLSCWRHHCDHRSRRQHCREPDAERLWRPGYFIFAVAKRHAAEDRAGDDYSHGERCADRRRCCRELGQDRCCPALRQPPKWAGGRPSPSAIQGAISSPSPVTAALGAAEAVGSAVKFR